MIHHTSFVLPRRRRRSATGHTVRRPGRRNRRGHPAHPARDVPAPHRQPRPPVPARRPPVRQPGDPRLRRLDHGRERLRTRGQVRHRPRTGGLRRPEHVGAAPGGLQGPGPAPLGRIDDPGATAHGRTRGPGDRRLHPLDMAFVHDAPRSIEAWAQALVPRRRMEPAEWQRRYPAMRGILACQGCAPLTGWSSCQVDEKGMFPLVGPRRPRGRGEGRPGRNGVEATLSQGARAFGMRRSRYRSQSKAHLQHLFTAAAMNLARLDAWTEAPWYIDNRSLLSRPTGSHGTASQGSTLRRSSGPRWGVDGYRRGQRPHPDPGAHHESGGRGECAVDVLVPAGRHSSRLPFVGAGRLPDWGGDYGEIGGIAGASGVEAGQEVHAAVVGLVGLRRG
ncbi:transposase [Embleya sp. NPDC008237]|uniref:transposase n=1 Tax=Embleya sp. NPDC008237 TaxID=3363978 RepID=UPI0036F1782F